MFTYVIEFLEENNILYEYQFGCQKNNSTNHAIITLVERVPKALDTVKYVVGVFLDLKKAFDTIDHTILLRKWHKRQHTELVYKLFILQKSVCRYQ